jgi:hypothetical protein
MHLCYPPWASIARRNSPCDFGGSVSRSLAVLGKVGRRLGVVSAPSSEAVGDSIRVRRCAPSRSVGQGWDRSERSSALMSAASRWLWAGSTRVFSIRVRRCAPEIESVARARRGSEGTDDSVFGVVELRCAVALARVDASDPRAGLRESRRAEGGWDLGGGARASNPQCDSHSRAGHVDPLPTVSRAMNLGPCNLRDLKQ